MNKSKRGWLFVMALSWLLADCSRIGKAAHQLSPADAQFLSEVRFIITKSERKLFLKTPPEERKLFVDEFWKKRDPDPLSEENEFRDEYYNRIQEANHLFREGSSGWLTDRGRIYILLGAPEHRAVYPSGYSFYEPPVEIWYYGDFPIIFVDRFREGSYRLEPISARQIAMINIAQKNLKPDGISRAASAFDFSLKIETRPNGELTLLMAIPYKVLKLTQRSDDARLYETQVQMDLLISGPGDKAILQEKETFPVSLTTDMLANLPKNLELQHTLKLGPGSYSAQIKLENSTDNSQVSKRIKFKL